MIRWLDFWLFGNGHGLAAPHWDQAFYWLNGEFYTFCAGFGAQLHSFQWTHPKPGEERIIQGVKFRPFQSSRTGPRVMVSWATTLPADIDEANRWLREFRQHLSQPALPFRFSREGAA